MTSKLLEIISRVQTAITTHAPQVQAVEAAVNAAADAVAAASPGTTAAVAALHAVENIGNLAVNTVEGIVSSVAVVLSTDAQPALTSTQVAAITALPVSQVDPATLAAGNVVGASDTNLAQRVAVLESSLVEILGIVESIVVPFTQIAKQFGL